MDDRTRDSGSYSNLSDSSRRLGQRRRSTVEVGRSDVVSVPRSTAKHGRRRRFSRYGRDVVLGVALSFLHARDVVVPRWSVSLATTCRFSSTSATEQRHTVHGSRLCTDVPLELSFECLHCSKSVVELRGTVDDNKPARNSRAHANCSELSRTRMFLRENTTPHTELQLFSRPRTVQVELMTSEAQHTGTSYARAANHVTQVQAMRAQRTHWPVPLRA